MTLPRTPSQTVGPFFSIGLCRRPENELVPEGMRLVGRLLDGQELPVNDGVIELFEPSTRRWGRCGTDGDGRFAFVVPDAPHFEAHVFARGLLRHRLTRIYARAATDDVDETLVAEQENGALRFDIRLQGERQTVFFDV
jgi:protocatechuate 3,4-dioxygenase alpha subunit